MDAYDRHLLSFVLTWAPFGGPPEEDSFPRFGLPTSAIYERFDRIVAAVEGRTADLDEIDLDLVRRARAVVPTVAQECETTSARVRARRCR